MRLFLQFKSVQFLVAASTMLGACQLASEAPIQQQSSEASVVEESVAALRALSSEDPAAVTAEGSDSALQPKHRRISKAIIDASVQPEFLSAEALTQLDSIRAKISEIRLSRIDLCGKPSEAESDEILKACVTENLEAFKALGQEEKAVLIACFGERPKVRAEGVPPTPASLEDLFQEERILSEACVEAVAAQ
jgi:hypothetical protein